MEQDGTLQSATDDTAALRARVAALEREVRLLRVSYGSTFEELEAAGKVGGGRVYRFEDLLSLSPEPTESSPPLIFVHVPKTGGTTIKNVLMRNFRSRLDSYGNDFFPRYYPDEFLSLVHPRIPDDTRRPVFFAGHIDIANDIFRYMPVPYLAIAILRDPVSRIVSQYRAESVLPTPVGAEMRAGKISLLEYFRRLYPPRLLQRQIFAPTSGDVDEALHNLKDKISLFGLQERTDEFMVMLGALLGLPDIVHAPLNVTSSRAVQVPPSEIDEIREVLSDDTAFYQLAKALYEARVSQMPEDFAERVDAYRREKQQYLTRREGIAHPWSRFYA
jgi:sulfotransferase famil protein